MTVSLKEFTTKIKTQYPQYQSIDDNELTKKILEKYPQYTNQINPQELQSFQSKSEVGTDLGSSLKAGLGAGLEAGIKTLAGPIGQIGGTDVAIGAGKGALSTISGMSELGQRGLQAVTGIKPQLQEGGPFQVRDGVAGLKEGYTKPEGFAQEAGFAGEQIGEFFIPGGAIVKAAKIPKFVKGAAMISKLPKGAQTIARGLPKLSAEAASVATMAGIQEGRAPTSEDFISSLAVGAALRGGSKVLKGIGKTIYGTAIPSTPTQKAILQKRGIDLSEELINTMGPSKNKTQFIKNAKDQMTKYRSQVDNIILKTQKSNPAANKINSKELLVNISKNTDDILRRAPESDALKILKALTAEKNAAIKRFGKKPITLEKVNEMKKLFDSKINYDKLDYLSTAKNAVDKSIADSARNILKKFNPKITELNAKIGPLAEATKILTKKGEYSGYLTDVIAAANAGTLKGAVGNVFLKRIATAFPSKTTIGTGLYKAGKAISSPAARTTLQAGAAKTF